MSVMPQPEDLPVLFLPRNLSPAAAAHFIDALHQLLAAMERHYGAPPLRNYHPHDIGKRFANGVI